MNSVASSAVLGLLAVPPMAAYATSNNKERHVDRAVCQPGAAPREDEALQLPPHCFVEGAMIAPSINDEALLKEEQP
jgi:hypothetical protein